MGWTQSELAEKADLSRAAICTIEGAGKYKANPSQKALARIVEAFGISMAQFYGSVRKPKKSPKAATLGKAKSKATKKPATKARASA